MQAGKSEKWVAQVLGHADATITLQVYAHAMPEDDMDLSFTEFDGDRRRYTATDDFGAVQESPNYAELMERETGFEPATLSLGNRKRGQK